MVAPSSGRLDGVAGLVIAGLLMLGVTACAGGPKPGDSALSARGEVAEVRVEHDTDLTIITLLGVNDPIYTAYLDREGELLVVDLSEIPITAPSNVMAVYDSIVDQVTLSAHAQDVGASTTRVEIQLAREVDYEVVPSSEGLLVLLQAKPGEDEVAEQAASPDESISDEEFVAALEAAEQERQAGEAAADPWAASPELAAEDSGALARPSGAALATPPAATKLVALDVETMPGGVLFHLAADGQIAAVQTFTLTDPSRLVLDLPGLGSALTADRMTIDSQIVGRIRVGEHSDKLRLVIDGASEASFDGRQVVPAADGMFVSLGSGADVDQALAAGLARADAAWASLASSTSVTPSGDAGSPASPDMGAMAHATQAAPVEEIVEASAPEVTEVVAPAVPVQIYGIQFDGQETRDRVAVLGDSVMDYKLHAPDPETLVVRLLNATIEEQAEGRLAPTPGGPVGLVTAFQQPEVDNEVRIVVKRVANLEPEITRHGGMLFFDFPNVGQAAALPPAFENIEEMAQVPAEEMPELPVDSGMQPGSPDTPVASSLDDLTQPEMVPYEPSSPNEMSVAGGIAMPVANGAPASMEPPAAIEILQEGGLTDGKQYEGRRISLDFKDVPIADVLRLIADVSDLNLIAGDEVGGNITIRLVEVPWDQALDVILLTKGLGFVRVGNVLRIAPADIIAQEEELRLQERRNKEKLEDLVVKLQPVNYADVGEMAGLVRRLLSERGSVNTDVRTNTLIIKDIPSVIDEATALVHAVDTETPQVLIEAKIVEAGLDFSRELGSVWSVGTADTAVGSNKPLTISKDGITFAGENNIEFANPITADPTAVANFGALLLDDQFNVTVQLQAAESAGEGKVISSPRVVTLDNTQAKIEQGVSIPFQTFEGGDAQLEFVDAVLSLSVTPHITSDRSIIMKVEVKRNAPDDTVATPTGSPAIAKAEATTETLVKDGQTLVIGGIYTIIRSERERRVPYLHRLPILGVAFRSKEITDSRKELLIFITPRIVISPELAEAEF